MAALSKIATHLVDAMTDPKTRHSEEMDAAASHLGLRTGLNMFDFFELPENAIRRKVFAKCMSGSILTQPPATVLSGTR